MTEPRPAPTSRPLGQPFDLTGKRVWVAGHRGLVGGAVVRRLAREDCAVLCVGREDLDLTRQQAVEAWMEANRPDAVVMAAALVGGIKANDRRSAEFIHQNLAVQTNIIHAAWQAGVGKVLFLGSSCIYPRDVAQPMREDALLSGPLEPTNQWYAIAKIAGIRMAQAYRRQYGCDYISAMPTNLYGPGDNFDLDGGHVLPALLRKIHEAKVEGRGEVVLWGSGAPLREFLYVDDLADALVFLLKAYSADDHINVGSGEEITIKALAETIAGVVGYEGRFVFDTTMPDGTPRKLMDSGRLAALGWRPATDLRSGIAATYRWFLDNAERLRQ
ncbi:GDP-L-fucose synthase family protein [Rhodospirillum rubrum]|uniref:GDP-L-fucose synthase n=1 Tax=Rhodospirillum rubrum (strain ATCC 11170 / ATH 1.1.1 / DSM 467 / LMG 4362 / NCIMB 8255 / S1) TaxID=269796 RepID=Q2RXT6_RHORT|nr:GDP-L-fucose synthase [Rhodospirillum rubrum]ABC21059.1 NAD-dependent epimerase/dehydratase [Rhodospirillum rubrum ATCC 11170]AEO46727.1 NAD-dependent epimerase/dehydratase [Rhodospirillum rubrum F11]MBK5952603.1 GDP-fucose synthetase [Rhodospirillum rubrum]